ncbi:MAG: penicillin-binding transpeptidase domain-containing protein [Myxococcota bacterium]
MGGGPTTTGLGAHLLFLSLLGLSAAMTITGALLAVVRSGTAGTATRVAAGLASVLSAAAVIVAAAAVPGIPASAFGLDAASVTAAAATAVSLASLLLAWSAAEPRVAVLTAATAGLTATGLLIQLLLYGAAPDPADAVAWELRRLSTMCTFAGIQTCLVAAIGWAITLRPIAIARPLHLIVFIAGAVSVSLSSSLVGGASLREAAVVGALLLPTLGWLAWSSIRAREPVSAQAMRAFADDIATASAENRGRAIDSAALFVVSAQQRARAAMARFALTLSRLPTRPSAALAAGALAALLSIVAVLLAAGGSARDAARVDVGGLAFTPSLLVPFVFAPALGLVLGSPGLRARGFLGLVLTFIVTGLLVAQKEIGYTGVVLGIAAVAFLTSRGTLLHLVAAGGFAAVGLGLAFELQPVLPWIPFTVRERVLLWMGGAGFFRRGGHLLAADRVTYDLGGIWGLGVQTPTSLDLHRTVNSLDTDFPLAVVGLFGGMPWLVTYVGLFVGFAVVLYDIARRQGRRGSMAGWRLPAMAGLATVPVASTAVSLSGGLTHLTPFAGVPAAFISYGSFYMAGLLLIVALFLVLGSDAALADRLLAAQRSPKRRLKTSTGIVERDVPPEPWWLHPSWPAVRLFVRRLSSRFRLSSVDAGALLLIAGVIAMGVVWSGAIDTRYSRRLKVYTHPSLVDSVHIRNLVPGVWEVPPPAPPGWSGILQEGHDYRLDGLEMQLAHGQIEVTGACLPRALAERRPLRVGFEGLVMPKVTRFGAAGRDLAAQLGATMPEGNDLVLPLAPVWLHHLEIEPAPEGRVRVRAASTGARFVLDDQEGRQVTTPRGGFQDIPWGWTVALADDPRLHLTLEQGNDPETGAPEICLRNKKTPLFSWELSRWRDTEIGGLDLLRRAPVDRSIDFEFAEDLKRIAESGLAGVTETGQLWVTPWDKASRERWDPLTAKRFKRIFRVTRDEDGSEVLRWVRGFYRDGSTRVRFDEGWDSFASGWEGELLGLADPYRFSRDLPEFASKKRDSEPGRLLDTRLQPLAQLSEDGERWEVQLTDAGALIGWGFPKRAIWGGLLRVFHNLLMGRQIRPSDADEELTERVLARDGAEIGADIILTLNREIQEATTRSVQAACARMRNLALAKGDSSWMPHGRAIVLGPEGEVVAAASCPGFDGNRFEEVLHAVEEQRVNPVGAAGLDAWQRTTTVGSTAKVGLLVAASRDPSAHFAPYGQGELCIRAEDDPINSQKGGCFVERGSLSSFRGEPIEPVRNYGGAFVGGVTTVRQLLVRSVNTASSYLAGRLRLAGFQSFYNLLEVLHPYDLMPERLGLDPRFAADIERFPNDPLTAWRVRLGELPPGPDTWRTTYDVRLGLSGFSDFSVLHVALAESIVAKDGRHYRPYLVRGIRDLADGSLLEVKPQNPLQVIPVRMARHLKEAGRDTIHHGTAAWTKRRVPEEVWREMGGKTGTGETTRRQPEFLGKKPGGRKPKTQDHKFFAGYWPFSSRNPFVIVVGFEYVSHLDTHVALQTYAEIVMAIREELARERATPPPP